MPNIYNYILNLKKSGKKSLFVLIDPDKDSSQALKSQAVAAQDNGAAAIFIGGSYLSGDIFDRTVRELKTGLEIPLIIFPGGSAQLSPQADAVLFLSLISGRNPQYLIGEHVTAAPVVKKMGLEVISTAYMLIEAGRTSAVEFVSNTKPIPREQTGIAAAHAIAAEMLGMKMVYLEAGSGALQPVPAEMITAVRKSIDLPLIVGGGIRSPEQAQTAVSAGADFIVVGNALEKGEEKTTLLNKIVKAIN